MSIGELILRRREQLKNILEKNIPFQRAVLTTVNKQSERIFNEGLTTAGSKIGQYDTKRPLYINPNKSPRKGGNKAQGIQGLLPTKGKTGERKFKNGKEHKTTYVNNYKDFRNRIGRRIDFVNLNLSGDLRSDYASGIRGSHNPEKISPHEYKVTIKRPDNLEKLSGLENKYGTITKLSQGEKQNFFDILSKEIKLALQ